MDDLELDVHGGITLTGYLNGKEGEWLGFDCAHWGDEIPAAFRLDCVPVTYRTLSYVEKECAKLAKQIEEMGE